MLGRLRMSIDECEAAYLSISRTIFTQRRRTVIGRGRDFLQADGKFDSQVFEEEIKKQIRANVSTEEDANEILLKEIDSVCKVYDTLYH